MASSSPPAARLHRTGNGIVVIKIGTSSVMRDSGTFSASDGSVASIAAERLRSGRGELAISTLALVVDTLVALRRAGHPVVLVTSGAVGVGCLELGIARRPTIKEGASGEEKARVMAQIQAFAAVGQNVLMTTYNNLLKLAGVNCAQVLLTSQDLGSEYQYENAKNTLRQLLEMGVVPIVNENDCVATEEIKFGDNDWISALVSSAVSAEWLFILTDVDQLYTANPKTHRSAKPIDVVEDVDALEFDCESPIVGSPVHNGLSPTLASPTDGQGQAGTQWGTGGMATKIIAARLATAAGVRVGLVHGRHPERVLGFVLNSEDRLGTVFLPKVDLITDQRSQWISQALPPRGSVLLSEKTVHDLRCGKKSAVTTVDVIDVKGVWVPNSAVIVCSSEDQEIGRGICCYGSGELLQFKGMDAAKIFKLIGTPTNNVVIHAHDFAMSVALEKPSSDGAIPIPLD